MLCLRECQLEGPQRNDAQVDLKLERIPQADLKRPMNVQPHQELRVRDTKLLLGEAREWVKEKNFAKLIQVLEGVEVDLLKDEYLVSGVLPLEGWVGLNNVFRETKCNLLSNQQELSVLSNRIDQLNQELVLLESQRATVLQQIDLANSSPSVERVFQFLAVSEQELLGGFKEKIASPGWSIDLMGELDVKIAFSLLRAPHLLAPLLKAFDGDRDAILLLDFHVLEEINVPMSMEEKTEVLYVVNMIGLKQFDRELHKEKCGICRIDDVQECFLEQGISPELFEKIRHRVVNLKPYQVIMFPSVTQLVQGIGLSLLEKSKFMKALNTMNRIHSEA